MTRFMSNRGGGVPTQARGGRFSNRQKWGARGQANTEDSNKTGTARQRRRDKRKKQFNGGNE